MYEGREESVGVGIQGGSVAVVPQIWPRHLSNGLRPVVNKQQNTSAMGRPEQVNGSAIVSRTSAGPLEFKLQDISFGYWLASLFGKVTTAANPDASGVVYDHTFSMAPSERILLSVTEKNPVDDRVYKNVEVSQIEITSEQEDWVKFTVDLVGAEKADATSTVAIQDEHEFTSAHVAARIAANVAGLGAAPDLEITKQALTLSRPRSPYVPLGHKTSVANDTEPFTASGELTLRYKNTDMEDLWYENTVRALRISIINDDPEAKIGTAEQPGVVFTAPQVTFEGIDRSTDLDQYVEVTVSISCELSVAEGYAIRPVLTNTQEAYEAA